MLERVLFIDGSVDTKSKIGFGAYLLIDSFQTTSDQLQDLRVTRFENTSSTKLEIQTALHAFKRITQTGCSIILYTDSQNIVGLPERRNRLEKSDYRSKSGSRIRNYELYREFYAWMDRFDFQIVKVKGHQRNSKKDSIDKLFSLVDRAARKALRENNSKRV